MQTYNQSLLTAGMKGLFLQTLSGAELNSYVPQIATVMNSYGSDEDYAWIGESPALQEFDGTLKYVPMSDGSYNLVNTKYAVGVAIKRDDLADDKVGGLAIRIQQLALNTVGHKNKLLIDALINGTTNTGHDSNAFFSATHPIRGQQTATQSNIVTGTGTTTAQIQADITSAIVRMLGFKAENNEPFHEEPQQFKIVAPPALLGNMNEAVFASIISNTSNVRNRGISLEPIFTSRLSDANDWYLLHVGGSVRPLIMQDREPVTLEESTTGSEAAFQREQWEYKVRGRYAVGYGHWANAVKVANT